MEIQDYILSETELKELDSKKKRTAKREEKPKVA